MTAHKRIHYAQEVLYGCLAQPLCENQAGRDAIADAEREVEMTDDESEVTCRRCLKALGFEPAPVEQLTEVHGDPLIRRAA